MDAVVDFLLRQGAAGVLILALGYGYREERKERQLLQARLEAAQSAHSDAHVATIKETTAAMAAVERAILSLRGGGNG